jgi:hypothetical protein
MPLSTSTVGARMGPDLGGQPEVMETRAGSRELGGSSVRQSAIQQRGPSSDDGTRNSNGTGVSLARLRSEGRELERLI